MELTSIPQKNRDFFSHVYQVVELIPEGRVTSYGAIAKYLGLTRAARMVGWAMNNITANHPHLPAHRVVNRVGLLTGKLHFHPPEKMAEMLEKEGVEVKNDQVINFEKLFWDPNKELEV